MTGERAWRAIGLLGGALLWSIPAWAQLAPSQAGQIKLKQVPPAPSDDIVVTAPPRPTVSQVTKQAEAITPGRDKVGQPLPQFEDPICPGVMGLPRDIAELIVDRVRYDAGRARIRATHGATCTPNLLIVVTRNGQAEVKALMARRGYLFSDMSSVETQALANDAGPVHAWAVVVRRGRDGQNFSGSMIIGADRFPELSEWAAHSKIYLATRLEIRFSIVLIDVAAIDGLSVNQIADYAAMRTLAITQPPRGTTATSTILTLFDHDGHAPLELSDFDLSYLRRTYADEPNLPAYDRLADIAHDVRKAKPAPKPASTTTPAPDAAPNP